MREGRGSGLILLFDDDTNMPSNFESNFLSYKTNLNEYLVKKLSNIIPPRRGDGPLRYLQRHGYVKPSRRVE